MYKSFFGLSRNAFEITPDPRFFFGTARHNEALASLCYGLERRKGFTVITGEVGTGKTLLAQCLFRILTVQKTPFAYVFNPLLPPVEFLAYVANDMGISAGGKNKGELLGELNRYLIAQYQRSSTAVLIVDEAQLLSWELLEEIRLLTNLETAEQKLLQIVLMGQPEFDEKLELQGLRQLKQRIALRCRLEPLSLEETQRYIASRLLLAGSKEKIGNIFPSAVVELIHRYSHGIPRLVNTICEAALVSSFALTARVVSPEVVHEVAADFHLLNPSHGPKKLEIPPCKPSTSDNAEAVFSSRAVAL